MPFFLGCHFDGGTIEEAVYDILTETRGAFKYVVTPNVHHMVRLIEVPAAMQPLYERAWRVFCDSRVLSRLAWFSGVRLAVITGSDLTAQLVARAAEQHLTIALIGPTAEACTVLGSKYPGLNAVSHTPPMGFIRSEHQIQKCVDFVVKNRPPLIFLALGMPQQEILAGHIADHPHTRGVGLCIGASIDFLTGKQPRAPVSFQKAGLEWLYRLLSDPRRLASRYLIECPRIFYYCLKETSVFAREGVAGFMATGAVLAPLSAVVLQNLGFGALYGICLTVVWLSMSQAAYVVGMTYLQARAR